MNVLFIISPLSFSSLAAQDVIVNPDISYAGTPRQCEIGGITVKGVEGYEDYVLIGLSGLSVGQRISVPGTEITEAVKRYWKHGLFSKAAITADSLVGSKVYLCIHLATRPRVSTINYYGLKKSEREDMESKLGIMKGSQITPNMIDRAKILAKKYFDDKGYKNADIKISQRDDVTGKNEVILDVEVDKKSKMRVRKIIFEGNEQLTDKKRHQLREVIERDAVAWAVGIVTPEEIDKINILNASFLAMHRALDQLNVRPQAVIVDGNRFRPYIDKVSGGEEAKPLPHTCIVKGDGKYLSIAAASILAKTYRDDYMDRLAAEYPQYDWKSNKGYPTKKHRDAIRQYGTTPYHRMSYNLLGDGQLTLKFED